MIRAVAASLATVALVFVLAACGAESAEAAAAAASPVATMQVDLPQSYKFVPLAITVATGSTVTWTNHDQFTHNVTLPDGTPPLTMAPGQSVTHVFDKAGDFPYMCSLHPKDMRGRVVVTAS